MQEPVVLCPLQWSMLRERVITSITCGSQRDTYLFAVGSNNNPVHVRDVAMTPILPLGHGPLTEHW